MLGLRTQKAKTKGRNGRKVKKKKERDMENTSEKTFRRNGSQK